MLGRRDGAAGGLFALQCPQPGFFLLNGDDALLAEPAKAGEEIRSTGSSVGSAVVAVEHAAEVEQQLGELQVVALVVELLGQVFDVAGLHLVVAAETLHDEHNHGDEKGNSCILAVSLCHGDECGCDAEIAAVDEALLGESQQVIHTIISQQRVLRGVALQQPLTFDTLRRELRILPVDASDQLVGVLRQ